MEFFQFTGEMGNTGALPVVRRALAANISGAMYDVVPSPAHECQRRRRRCGLRRESALWLLYWAGFLGLKKLSAMKAASQLMSGPIWKRSSCHLIQLSNQPVDWVGNVSGSPWFSSVQIA